MNKTAMKIKLMFFASIRESMNISEIDIDLPDETNTIFLLNQYLSENLDNFANLSQKKSPVLVAINQEIAQSDTIIKPNDTVAFFPPVTGG